MLFISTNIFILPFLAPLCISLSISSLFKIDSAEQVSVNAINYPLEGWEEVLEIITIFTGIDESEEYI